MLSGNQNVVTEMGALLSCILLCNGLLLAFGNCLRHIDGQNASFAGCCSVNAELAETVHSTRDGESTGCVEEIGLEDDELGDDDDLRQAIAVFVEQPASGLRPLQIASVSSA